MKRCPNCAAEVADENNLCPSCGTSFQQDKQEAKQETAGFPPTEQPTTPPTSHDPSSSTPKKKLKTWQAVVITLVIVLVVCPVLTVAGCVGCAVINGQNSNSGKTETQELRIGDTFTKRNVEYTIDAAVPMKKVDKSGSAIMFFMTAHALKNDASPYRVVWVKGVYGPDGLELDPMSRYEFTSAGTMYLKEEAADKLYPDENTIGSMMKDATALYYMWYEFNNKPGDYTIIISADDGEKSIKLFTLSEDGQTITQQTATGDLVFTKNADGNFEPAE